MPEQSMPLRRAIENAVDALITLLNEVDGDADVESNGDEGDYSLCDWRAPTYGIDQTMPLESNAWRDDGGATA